MISIDYNSPGPVASAFIRCRDPISAIYGPIGSGKSAACVIKILSLCVTQRKGADGIRRSRWAIVRNTREMLKDTTITTWFDWIKPHTSITANDRFGVWREVDRTFILSFSDVYAEILFRPLDRPEDVGRLLSLELTGVWFNECREIPVTLFGRAFERCNRYPSIRNGGSAWSGAIADTNAPMFGSDWYKVFEKLPQKDDEPNSVMPCTVFKQPSGLHPNAENRGNIREDYYTLAMLGKTQDEIDVYIHGNYGVSEYGKPVYARQFRRLVHVSPVPLKIISGLPVIIGIDPGLHFGAALFQVDWKGRVFLLREISTADIGLKTVCETKLIPMLRNTFSGCPVITIIDPAGLARSANDERRATDVLRSYKIKCRAAQNNAPASRIQALRQLLESWTEDGPKFLIDPSCKVLIEGFTIKYMFQKYRDGNFSESPLKNDWSHVMDAAGYAAMYLTSGFCYEDATDIDEFRVILQGQSTPIIDSYTGY